MLEVEIAGSRTGPEHREHREHREHKKRRGRWIGLCTLLMIAGLLLGPRTLAGTGMAFSEGTGAAAGSGALASDWYAVSDSGTYIVSGSRIVLLRGVQLSQEWKTQLAGLLAGALWRQGWLVFYAHCLQSLWPQLPVPAQLAVRVASQGWLLWSLLASLRATSIPLSRLWSTGSDLLRGQSQWRSELPIAIHDDVLSFRFFLRAYRPGEGPGEGDREGEGQAEGGTSLALTIDRVPEHLALSRISAAFDYTGPWQQLDQAMGAAGVDSIQLLSGASDRLQLRLGVGSGAVQQIDTDLAGGSLAVPWLLESIGRGDRRAGNSLYKSLLSQQVIELAGDMLSCYSHWRESGSGGEGCPAGQLMEREAGRFAYVPHRPVELPRLWDRRHYALGSVLPLTGCSDSGLPYCWEHYLVWSEGSAVWPWPGLTFYSRFADLSERNAWLLFRQEPQTWYTGSPLQIQVPESVSKIVLSLVRLASQALVHRMVLSVYEHWQGRRQQEQQEVFAPLASVAEPEGEGHTETGPCPPSGRTACLYQPCCVGACGRWRDDSLVDLGCSAGESRHQLCTGCFQGILRNTQLTPCSGCGQFHRSLMRAAYYQIDPEESLRGVPSVPMCPVCRTRFDAGRGTIGRFLGDECGAARAWLWWLFNDGLGR